MGVFIDRPVLDHRLGAGMDLQQLVETVVKEINLQVEAPTRHVLIKVIQIGIVIDIFELGYPAIMLAQHLRQGSLAGSDIPGYSDMLGFLVL
jgi:hypothetical protein